MSAITWICDVCDDPIDDGDGYIGVDATAATCAYLAVLDLECRQRSAGGIQFVSMSDLAALPKPERWFVVHQTCDPHPHRESDYHFDVARCRTVPELLGWNAHLSGKNWHARTDWPSFMQRRVGAPS
jgi:hypothetical protein